MSYDLYLVALPPKADIAGAMDLLQALEDKTDRAISTYDRRRLAEFLMQLDPRYERFEKDYQEIGKLMGITEAEARKQDDCEELNWHTDAKPGAQFIIYDDRVTIHWYSGTSEAEMNRYLQALAEETGYSVVDPQEGSIQRFPSKKASAK